MANLKEIRNRIDSVNSTKQITSAMKLVAAAKLRKAQDAIVKLRPYARKLREFMQKLSTEFTDNEKLALYTEERKEEKILMVAIASNKGLCGGFNNNVLKAVLELLETKYKEQYAANNVEIISIGKKIRDLLRIKKVQVQTSHDELLDNINFESVTELSNVLIDKFLKKEYDKILLIYNRFKNAATQELEIEQFLPLVPENTDEEQAEKDYIFEPNKQELLQDLVPLTLRTQFFKAVLDSNASEQGARMTAMHKATDNAEELVKDLKLHYNKVRQATITNEIIEIVGGAEALNC
jgi:F-type H+-transporting ATPase subunit gamma